MTLCIEGVFLIFFFSQKAYTDLLLRAQITLPEKEILSCLVEGMSYKMIADNCFISLDTVRSHIKNIYEKLHVHSKGEAVAKAIKSRIV